MDPHDGPVVFEPLPAPELEPSLDDSIQYPPVPQPLDDSFISSLGEDSASLGPPNRPLHPAEERRLVQEKEQEEGNGHLAGRDYYLVSRKWHLEWLQWVGHHSVQSPKIGPSASPIKLDVIREEASTPPPSPARSSSLTGSNSLQRFTKERPGPIDNGILLTDDARESGHLKRELQDHQDYEVLSEGVWELLHGWYSGGPPIKRRAVTTQKGKVEVDVYLLRLKVVKSSDINAEPLEMAESRHTTVEVLKKKACEAFGLEVEKVRIWDYFKQRKYSNLEGQLNDSLEDSRIQDENDILLEEQLADGSWPPEETHSTAISSSATDDVPTTGTPAEVGAVGLQNLGNTCFMNSSLQCLSNVPAMREYFTSGEYKESINQDAFKTAGRLAEAYAKLMNVMWMPSTTQVAPRNFKWQIGQFAEQFAGYGQQDSMEFIEYVLDGLKEDVNKVRGPKPFIELKEADGREDHVVAEEARWNYQQRNSSRVDDLFLGFFKSMVTCPHPGCGRVSVTFDPFLSVKLSLVSAAKEKQQTFQVTVVPLEGEVKLYETSVSKMGNADDIVEVSAMAAGLDRTRCVLAEVYRARLHKFFNANDAVERIGLHDQLVLYEMDCVSDFQMTSNDLGIDAGPEDADCASADKIGVVIQHMRCPTTADYGLPFVTVHDRKTTGAALMEAVENELRRHLGGLPDVEWKLTREQYRDHIAVTPEEEIVGCHGDSRGRLHLTVEWSQTVEALDSLQRLSEEPTMSWRSNTRQQPITLGKCLEMFTDSDQLSADDAWYCNRCKEHRQAWKKMDLWSLPPVLVLQLKRFVYTQYSRDRLDTPVEFPLDGLDLRQYAHKDSPAKMSEVYDLAALSKHMGGLGGGHYVAYARSSETGKWYYFNDSSVTLVDAETVASDQVGAYVLFYLRRDQRPKGWGPPPDEVM
mmetsp:Transcript_38868/g.91496  ORF Transcript_38868/g.91496 Transcript_38868/m.91496 type:complete len:920 (+) Transcript_38868:303-3062(+)